MGAYSATKFAQVGLAESLRSELAGSDIHVSVVFPVSTETEFFDVMSRETGAVVDGVPEVRARAPTRSPTRSPGPSSIRCPRSIRTRKSRGLVWLNALAPGFCDRLVKKYGRKPVGPRSGDQT